MSDVTERRGAAEGQGRPPVRSACARTSHGGGGAENKQRLIGAALGAVIAAVLFVVVELAALEAHGCNAFGCDQERIR